MSIKSRIRVLGGVKHILKYFRRIIYYMLVSLSNEMILIRNKELDLLFDEDSCRFYL